MKDAKKFARTWRVDGGGVGVLAVLVLAWWGVGVQPLMEARAARARSIDELAAKREELRGLEEEARKGETKTANAKQELERSSFRLGKPGEINTRIDLITQLALSAGLRVDAIKPSEPSPGTRYTSVPIKLSGVGTYQTSVGFLRALRDRYPDVGLMSFDLRSKPEQTATKAAYTFDLVWFTEPAAKPAGKNAK